MVNRKKTMLTTGAGVAGDFGAWDFHPAGGSNPSSVDETLPNMSAIWNQSVVSAALFSGRGKPTVFAAQNCGINVTTTTGVKYVVGDQFPYDRATAILWQAAWSIPFVSSDGNWDWYNLNTFGNAGWCTVIE